MKPSDLFVGIIDVFAVLLPGALFCYVYRDLAGQYVFPKLLPPAGGGARDVALFAFASYLAGHFIFLLGAKPLDYFYDRVRGRFYRGDDPLLGCVLEVRDERLAVDPTYRIGGQALRGLRRAGVSEGALGVLGGMSGLDPLPAADFRAAVAARLGREAAAGLEPLLFRHARVTIINAFQWAKANVELRAPAAAVEVHRPEAYSKFFRSLVVVILLVGPVIVYKAWDAYKAAGAAVVVGCLLALAGLSFFRYVDQRRKSIRLAYHYLIALEKAPKSGGG